MHKQTLALVLALAIATSGVAANAQDSQELAKQLSNPIASLISVPFQANWDSNIGPAREGERFTLNIQPVIPIALSEDWNMISRTIVPIIDQEDIFPGVPGVFPGAGEQFGLGDVVQSLFFSPAHPGPSGIIWGAGPVFLLPTGTDELLTADKWGIGPTAVVLKQSGGLTVGALANHIWSVAGDEERPDVSSTFLQPFISYTTPDAWTFSVNTESTYDWENEQWSVPVHASVSKLITLGSQPVSIGGTARYWAESPETGPDGWAARATFTLLFPKK
jgi:hypothetical protein